MVVLPNGQVVCPRVFAVPEWLDRRLHSAGMTLKDALSIEKLMTILTQEELVFFYGTFNMESMSVPAGIREFFQPYNLAELMPSQTEVNGEVQEKCQSLMDRVTSSFTTICGNLSAAEILGRYVSMPDMAEYVVAPTLWFVEDNVFCIRYSPVEPSVRTGAHMEFYSKACELLYNHYGPRSVANTALFQEYLKLRQANSIL